MKTYAEMSKEELLKEKESLEQQFKEVEAKGLNLNMARGKPSEAQLELSNGLMDVLNSDSYFNDETGTDCRNYGIGEGIPETLRPSGLVVTPSAFAAWHGITVGKNL